MRVVKSKRSGMGKSLYIRKLAKKLEQFKNSTPSHVTIPIHGPIVTPDTVLKFLREYVDQSFTSTIVHFDISPKVAAFCIIFIVTNLIITISCVSGFATG